jgi:hypothetical protein
MHRSFVRVLAVAVLAALLAACGDDGTGTASGTSTPTTTAPVPAAEYAEALCTAATDYQTTLDARNGEFQTGLNTGSPTPEDIKDATVAFLGDAADETQALAEEIRSIGVPDIDGGEEIAVQVVNAIEQAEDLFATTQDEVEALPTDDIAALTQGLQDAGTKLSEAANEIGSTFDSLESEELTTAAEDIPACADII